jgi:hypothetical protein
VGIYLRLNDEDIALKPGESLSWNLAYGLAPHISTLETTWISAARIAKMAEVQFPEKATGKLRTQQRRSLQDKPVGPLTLSMGDTDNGRAVEIKGVYVVVSNRPGTDYNTRTLVLADQRWFWGRTFIERSYNLRRKTGDFRLVRNEMAPIQVNRQRADFGFRKATLYTKAQPARPWKALEVLADVLTEICGPTGFVIDNPESLVLQDTIEGLELHDPGPQALGRILNAIPGAQIFIGEDGKAHVGNIYDQSERTVFEALPAGYAGDWRVIDKSAMRPSSYRIYFDREAELRFDYEEERSTKVDLLQTQVRDNEYPAQEPMWIENVIINPLYSLQLDASGDKYATMGEPIPLDQFIDACGVHGFNTDGAARFEPAVPGFKLTKEQLRRDWLGNWQSLVLHFCINSQLVINPERSKLLGALRRDFRQTYRIRPQWREKIRAIINNRAAILDYETGTRAPGSVFTQYITKFTQLGYLPYTQGKLAFNNDDYAENLDDKNPSSPFSITIEDNDMGIFRVNSTLDQTGAAETYMIGNSKDGVLPDAKKSAAVLVWPQISLDAGFKLAVIFTAIQDTPNNTGRLHMEEVAISATAEKLGIDPGVCRGPVVELAVESDTARFAWIDEQASDIRNAFYFGEDYPKNLLVNREEIRGLAIAAATQDVVRHLDKVEGRVTGPLTSQIPTGNLRTVTHVCAVGAGGRAVLTTTLAASGEVPVPQINSLLEEGTRRKVRRLVQP